MLRAGTYALRSCAAAWEVAGLKLAARMGPMGRGFGWNWMLLTDDGDDDDDDDDDCCGFFIYGIDVQIASSPLMVARSEVCGFDRRQWAEVANV